MTCCPFCDHEPLTYGEWRSWDADQEFGPARVELDLSCSNCGASVQMVGHMHEVPRPNVEEST